MTGDVYTLYIYIRHPSLNVDDLEMVYDIALPHYIIIWIYYTNYTYIYTKSWNSSRAYMIRILMLGKHILPKSSSVIYRLYCIPHVFDVKIRCLDPHNHQPGFFLPFMMSLLVHVRSMFSTLW